MLGRNPQGTDFNPTLTACELSKYVDNLGVCVYIVWLWTANSASISSGIVHMLLHQNTR